VLLAVGFNWLRLVGTNAGMTDFAFNGAIRSIVEMVVLIGLLWWAASGISRAERARVSERRAQSELDTHRMINAAQESERRRIARDLHDSVGQELTGLRLLLHTLPDKYGDEKLKMIEQQAARLDSELSMLVWQLRPKVLDIYGLVDALDNFTRAWAANNGMSIKFSSSGPKSRLGSEIETNLYRIVQEALNNIQKHAGAREVTISLDRSDVQAVLIVQDNGVGYSEGDEPIHNTESGGFGIIGMRERATILGGNFDIESIPGAGTCVTVRIPIH